MIRVIRRSSLLLYSALLLAAVVGLLFAVPGLWQNLFATGARGRSFMTHEHCYLEVGPLVAAHFYSDLLIGLAYVAISLTLAYLVHRARRDIPFHWVFVAFGLFIIACGSTHFMEVATTYGEPRYWLAAYLKLVTAFASVATAVVLPPLVPRALALVREAKLSGERRRDLEDANRGLEEANRRVRELDELRSQFFANVSHELRTPLTLILGPAQKLLGARELSDAQRRELETVERNARVLLKHVNDLLDISKLEAGKMTARYAETDLAELVRLTSGYFHSVAADRQIDYTVEAPPTLVAAADPEKLQRALTNLISNALKFTPGGGSVRCSLAERQDGKAVIEVSDTGPGVPAEMREAIFERFRQLEGGATRRFGGTGLGLAIAREMIELHGGRVSVSEADGGGALFRVEIPIEAPAGARVERARGDVEKSLREAAEQAVGAAEAEQRSAQPRRAGGDGSATRGDGFEARGDGADGNRDGGQTAPQDAPQDVRWIGQADQPARQTARAEQSAQTFARPASASSPGVEEGDGRATPSHETASPETASRVARLALAPLVLVVEDNPEMNRFVAETLSQTCRVVSASDGAEGVERARELRPDLVVSDVMMPGMSGEQLVAELRASDDLRDVSVLMLTAKADDELRVRLLRAGAQDFLTKPFTPAELQARAENLIQIKRTREMLQEELASRSGDLLALAREVAERRREMQSALDALNRSNRTLEAIIEASPLAIVTLDENLTVQSWNPAAERTFGWAADEAVGRPLPTVPEELREKLVRDHAAAVSGRSFTNLETVRRRKDGAQINVSISTAPLSDEEGRPRGVVALVADITERKRAEEAIRFQAHLLDTVEEAVIATDLGGAITYWNRYAEQMYGWRAAEVEGRNIMEVTPAETTREQADEIMACLRRGQSWTGEFTVRRRGGQTFPITITDTPIYDREGRMVGVVGVSRDITQRKRAEHERARLASQVEGERRRLKELVGNVPGVVWEAWGEPDAASQRINFVSDYVETMLGYTVEEWLSTPNFWLTIVHPEDRERAAAEARAKFDSRKGGTSQFRWVRKDGRALHVEAQSLVILDDAGNPAGMRGVTMDITERKRAEAAIRQSQQQLQHITDNAPVLIAHCDAERRYRFVNRRYCERFGLTRDEIIGRRLEEVLGEAAYATIGPYVVQTIEGRAVEFEVEVPYKGLGDRFMHCSYVPELGEGGEVTGFVAVISDITERKRAEAALRESEERFRSLADNVPVLIWINGLEGCEFVNRQYLEFLGRTMDEVREMDWTTALHPEDGAEYVASYLKAFEARAPFTAQFRFRRRDGVYRWLRSDGLPRFMPDGTFLGYVGSSFDVTDMKLAEEAVRASERRFRALVDQSPFSTQIFAPDGRTVHVNPAWESLWGAKLSDLPGGGYNILEDRQLEERGILALVRRGFAGEATRLPPIPYDPPAGEYVGRPRWVQAFIYPVKDEAGEVREVVLVHEDVSVRLRAEEALRESQARLEGIVESAMDAIVTVDEQQQVVLFNHAAEKMFGRRAVEAVGQQLGEFIPARFRADHFDRARAFGRAGVTTRATAVAGLRADGTEFPLEASISQIEAGGRKLYTLIMRDITERQRAEEERHFLADATAALASSLDYAATLSSVARLAANFLTDYCLVDLIEDDGRVRRLVAEHRDPARAERWREMQSRYPLAAESDHTVARVLREGRAELFAEVGADELARISPHATHAEELRRLGLRSAMTVPLVARGRTLGAITFVSVEASRAYGERELRLAEELARRAGLAVDNARLYQRAQEANRAKDEFLATLSHELRTPLTPIIGWIHLMRGGLRPEDIEHGLSVIDKNSQSLSRLINDLLDMSAILNEKMRIDRAPVSLDSVIAQAADTVGPQAAQRGVSIEFERCDPPRLEVSGDRTRLAQVFWNLLSNAVKFSSEGGSVRVRCERDGRVARVHVEDDGVGIAPEFLPRVFDRFQQADMSTTKQYGGLGIGLALVRSFVEAHGGTVTAASAGANRGSRFTVSLPLQESRNAGAQELRNADFGWRVEERRPAATTPAATPPPGGPATTEPTPVEVQHSAPASLNPQSAIRNPQSAGRVLVVEDALDTLEMLRVFLTARGYEVTACGSADEALRVAGGKSFDIIVSDIGLPDTDGYELLGRIRRELPQLARVPALAVTGYAAERDVELARAAGFAAHISKPFEPAELADAIARLLAAGP